METVLITGCSSGIGRATALAFLDEGWRVYATARDPDDIANLGDAGCETLSLDVTAAEDVETAVERVIADAGRIDCLVNNAGYGQYGPLEEISTEQLRRQFDVNVYGPHRLVRAVLPHMRDRGDGTIVNVSSVYGRLSTPVAGAYAGSKFALEAMSDALRTEVARFGVDVVLVEPGSVTTNFHDRAGREVEANGDRTDDYAAFYRAFDDGKTISRERPLANDPEDVASVILNAASSTSPAPRYTVGLLAKLGTAARFVPDSWRDALYRLGIRLAG